MLRRDFLIETSLAAVGLSMQDVGGGRDPLLDSLIEGWTAGIPKWLQEAKLPAASIAIVRDGRLAWRRAFGVKDTGTNEPVDGDSVFAACSNTKPVFAYGVMKLVERGLLDLDTPLARYTKRRITADPRIELITARHVRITRRGFPTGDRGRNSRFSSRRAPGINIRGKASATCSRSLKRSRARRSSASCSTTFCVRWE